MYVADPCRNGDLALANGILHLLVKGGQIVNDSFVAENVVFKRGIEDLEEIGYGCYGEDGLGLSPADGDAQRYGFSDQAAPPRWKNSRCFWTTMRRPGQANYRASPSSRFALSPTSTQRLTGAP